jgi:hypothetical protein
MIEWMGMMVDEIYDLCTKLDTRGIVKLHTTLKTSLCDIAWTFQTQMIHAQMP